MFISRPRELVDQLRQAKAGQERALVTLLHALLREHWRSIACDDLRPRRRVRNHPENTDIRANTERSASLSRS